jgi:hypothetical protein
LRRFKFVGHYKPAATMVLRRQPARIRVSPGQGRLDIGNRSRRRPELP